MEFKNQQENSKCEKQGTVDFNQAIGKLIHDNDECEDLELLDYLQDCYKDLLAADIEETTFKIEQRSNEDIVRECSKETINDGSFDNRTEIENEFDCWQSTTEENKLSETNLINNDNLNSNLINCNQSIQSSIRKKEQIDSIKDLIIFNNDHQYSKSTSFTNSNTFISLPTYYVKEEEQQQQQIQITDNLLTTTNLPPLTIEEVLNDNNQIEDDLIYNTNLNSQQSFYSSTLDSPSIESDSNSFLNDDSLYTFNQQPCNVSFDF